MDSYKQSDILKRIEQQTGIPTLAEKLSTGLSSSDFNSLLMEVFASRSENITPAEMLKLYAQNIYAKPADCDAVQYRRLELDMLLAAKEKGVPGISSSRQGLDCEH